MIRLLITVLMCCLLQSGASQDFVVLANGDRYEGKILDSRKKKVTIQLPDQEDPVVFPKSQLKVFRYDHRPGFPKTVTLELFLGSDMISPTSGIKKVLVEKRFDKTAEFHFFGLSLGSVDYPVVTNQPFYGAAIHYAIKPQTEIGMAFSTRKADISGFSQTYGFARMRYSAIQAIPTYRRYSPYHRTYWEVGMPLTFFQLGEGVRKKIQNPETAFSPGMKIGGGLVFFRKHVRDLQLKISYSIALPGINMDSFELTSDYDPSVTYHLFEDHRLLLHSLELGVVCGFRFRPRSQPAN